MSARHSLGLIVLLISLVYSSPSLAQSREGESCIRGRVISQHNQQPVRDAIVELLEGKRIVVRGQTDAQGYFRLILRLRSKGTESLSLRISHLTYEPYRTKLSQRNKDHDLGDLMLKERSNDLEEYVVTSTRALRHHKDVPVPVQVINRTKIERIAPTSTRDILIYSIPGIELSQHGGITHITMQGYKADYIAFLIDGEEVAGLKNGSIDLSRLSPDNIERVEVVKGAGSALYGSNAIAGVVNLVTRQYNQPLSLNGSAGYSQLGGWTSNLQAGFKLGRFNNSTYGSYDREAGYLLSSRDGSSSMNVLQNDVLRLGNSLRFNPTDNISLRWDLNHSNRRQYRNEYQHDVYDYLTNGLRAAWKLSPHSSLNFLYNADLSWRRREYVKANEVDTLHRNLVQTMRLQHDLQLEGGSNLSVGLEGHFESMLSDQIGEAKEKKGIHYGVLFAQHLWHISPRLRLLYGARADYHPNKILHFSPKATLSYKHRNWVLRGGYARAFKFPSLMELYFRWSHQGSFEIFGNPNLKPETANQLLVNAEWSRGGLSLSTGATHTLFHDRIVMRADSKGNQQHINIDGYSHMTVLDAQASWRIYNGINLSASYTFSYNPLYQKINGQQVNISRVRPHNLLLKLDAYKSWHPKWSVSASLIGQYLSGQTINLINQDSKTKELSVHPRYFEGYPMLRTTASLSYDHRITLSVSADNLLNYKANNIGVQNASLTPGRVFAAKLSFRL